MAIESTVTSIVGFIHQATNFIRSSITNIAPDYVTLILLGIALVGGYFLDKKKPALSAGRVLFVPTVVIWYALIIFLILKFI